MNKANIAEMHPAGTWEHPSGGTLYRFTVVLDDGTRGQASAKSETPWYSEGSEVAYRITGETAAGLRLKLDKPEYAHMSGATSSTAPTAPATTAAGAAQALACWAISEAREYLQARTPAGASSNPLSRISLADLRETAGDLLQLQEELETTIRQTSKQ